ncbi:hypothetical protein [Romboutsia sp.]|nr:hypothetical protein [Romboutsia sp.]HSQ88728.1 hypothetical protein [Romboutsia sp.]
MEELRGMEIVGRIEEVERSLKSYSNSEWETDMLKAEKMELENELRSLGY